MMLKRNLLGVVFATMVSVFVLGFASVHAADWVMYDNFNSGVLDPDPELWVKSRWCGEGVGDVYINSGKLRMVLNPGYAGIPIGIHLKQNGEQIKGIKLQITIISMENDARWKIDSNIGTNVDSGGSLWTQFGIKAGENEFYYEAYTEEPDVAISNQIIYCDSIVGSTFTLVDKFEDPLSIIYRVKDIFSNKFDLKNEAYEFLPIPTRSIIMKSDDGTGSCIIEIDNVKILIGD